MSSFHDIRETVPKHGTKRFPRRAVRDIRGVVIHQTAGGDNVNACALYHTGPNHVCGDGCPGLLYTFFIDQAGRIWWANDLEAATYSQGGRGSPIPGTAPNKNFLSIVCGGDFDGPTYKGDDGHPTALQLHAVLELVLHLTGERESSEISNELWSALSCTSGDLYGHAQFGKANCPGSTLQAIADGLRGRAEVFKGPTEVWSAETYQTALANLGYLSKGQVDGIWGPQSRSALVRFQTDRGIEADGLRGPLTQSALREV
jgi:hypothetical protein